MKSRANVKFVSSIFYLLFFKYLFFFIEVDIEGFEYKATSGEQNIFNTVNIMAVTCIYGMDISRRERIDFVYIKRRMSSLNLTCKSLKMLFEEFIDTDLQLYFFYKYLFLCISKTHNINDLFYYVILMQNIVQALQNAYTFYTGEKMTIFISQKESESLIFNKIFTMPQVMFNDTDRS
ncbi:hypothetical protein KUTeg_015337 [Tegillarca granosa]|uniref:Uncharacterized protein n=1 Tax=Tegillarca granosa TaxID=220873 RepID=A0ABQ9EPU6_TEGGR|nr:hypothetical protein KUTeg_015337 [Tegillarca granosa]